MNDVMWYLSRATGIVAAVLAVAALAVGLLVLGSGDRHAPPARLVARPAQLARRPRADLHRRPHRHAYLDGDAGLSLASLFVPGVATSQRLALAWGVVAAYLFATTVLTSWPRKRFSRRTWRILHLGSVVGVALAFVHAYQMGTDGSGRAFRIGVLLLVAVGTYTLFIRLIGAVAHRRARPAPPEIHSGTQVTSTSVRFVRLNGHMEHVAIDPPADRRRSTVRPGGTTRRTACHARVRPTESRQPARGPPAFALRRGRQLAASGAGTSAPASTCRTGPRHRARFEPRLDRRLATLFAFTGGQSSGGQPGRRGEHRDQPGDRAPTASPPPSPVELADDTPAASAATTAARGHAAAATVVDGAVFLNKWGDVQVEATFAADGTLVDVTALQTPYGDGQERADQRRARTAAHSRSADRPERLGRHRVRCDLHQRRLPPVPAVGDRRRQRGRASRRSSDDRTCHTTGRAAPRRTRDGHRRHLRRPRRRPAPTAASTRLLAWLHHVDETFSPYIPDSPISRLGRAEITLDDVDDEVTEVLLLCESAPRGHRWGLRRVRRSGTERHDARPVRRRQGLVDRTGGAKSSRPTVTPTSPSTPAATLPFGARRTRHAVVDRHPPPRRPTTPWPRCSRPSGQPR